MAEDEAGLLVTSYISEQRNGHYRKMYSEGLITEHSVGFIPVVEEMDREREVNLIKEIRLFEYSSVVWGANPDTTVVDMKALAKTEQGLERLKAEMDKLSKVLRKGTLTDETMHNLTISYEQIKNAVFDALEVAPAPDKSQDNGELNELKEVDLVQMFNQLQK
jgi:hypothetical protein